MTAGERAVWAAVYAAHWVAGSSPVTAGHVSEDLRMAWAARCATKAVAALRDARQVEVAAIVGDGLLTWDAICEVRE